LAGVGPVETLNNVNMQKIQIILSEQQRMKKYLPNSVGFHSNSLCKVGIACYEVKISSSCPCSFEKDSAWQSDQQWSIDSSGQNQSVNSKRNKSSDRIDNRSILDQSKERRKLPAAESKMAIVSSSKKTKFTKCRQARPADFGVLRRPPPYCCYPVDGLRLGLRVLIRLIFIC
jgi:hypothetical protein